jgi:hypothetical protein
VYNENYGCANKLSSMTNKCNFANKYFDMRKYMKNEETLVQKTHTSSTSLFHTVFHSM